MDMTRTQSLWLGGLCGLCVLSTFLVGAQDEARHGEWRSSGGDSSYQRYSPLAQITRDNVKNLRILWRRPALDPKLKEQFPKLRTNNYLRATPTMIGGVLYAPDAAGLIEAFDATTGETLLFIGDGSNTFGGVHPSMWGKKFRAYDKATGRVIWETELPAGTTSGPMTYLAKGKQYIVVPIGGRDEPAEWVALGLQ
jgi:glucose dehydrogenase